MPTSLQTLNTLPEGIDLPGKSGASIYEVRLPAVINRLAIVPRAAKKYFEKFVAGESETISIILRLPVNVCRISCFPVWKRQQ